ncbi:MAG TPA: hypothetical protein VF070_29760 [Streptosporangiaceae bacterium]
MANEQQSDWATPLPSAPATEPTRPKPPAALRTAVWLMGIGGGFAFAWGMTSAMTAKPTGRPLFGDPSTEAYRAGFAVAGAFAGLILAGLWAWMAWKNDEGRSWARIVSTVFFGITCLYSLSMALELVALLRFDDVSAGPLALISLVFAQWVVGLLALILLWRPESSRYFQSLQPVPPYIPLPGWYPASGNGQQATGNRQPQD